MTERFAPLDVVAIVLSVVAISISTTQNILSDRAARAQAFATALGTWQEEVRDNPQSLRCVRFLTSVDWQQPLAAGPIADGTPFPTAGWNRFSAINAWACLGEAVIDAPGARLMEQIGGPCALKAEKSESLASTVIVTEMAACRDAVKLLGERDPLALFLAMEDAGSQLNRLAWRKALQIVNALVIVHSALAVVAPDEQWPEAVCGAFPYDEELARFVQAADLGDLAQPAGCPR